MELSPSVYEHAAAVIGRTPWDVSRDAELLVPGPRRGLPALPADADHAGHRHLQPRGRGLRGGGRRARRVRHPGDRTADLRLGGGAAGLRPLDPRRDGRIPMVIGVAARLAREFPETQVRVPVSGPFSIASNLVGFENLLVRRWRREPDDGGRGLDAPGRRPGGVCRGDPGSRAWTWRSSSRPPARRCCRRPCSAGWSCRP